MENPEEVAARLKPLAEISSRDAKWDAFDKRTLEQHHQRVGEFSLHGGVPTIVLQCFENARNTWLYSFFNFPLLKLAHVQAHLAGEVAIKERARLSGVDTKTKTLKNLLDMAISQGWLLNPDLELAADQNHRQAQHREMLRYFRIPFDPLAQTIHAQEYANELVEAFRQIRNALADSEQELKPNVNWEFSVIQNLINQLFPQQAASALK